MPEVINYYQCSFCKRTMKTEVSAIKHEKRCSSNTEYINITKDIETIRLESVSVQDLVHRVKELLLSLGIKLHLQEYPSLLRKEQSYTTANATGWYGKWEGSVEVVDASILCLPKDVCFIDIVSGGAHKLLNLPFIRTRTWGRGGVKFKLDGEIHLKDFPKMYEKFLVEGGAISTLSNEYNTEVGNYISKFSRASAKYISYNPLLVQVENIRSTLRELCAKIDKDHNNVYLNLKTKFVEDYSVKLPMPPDPFCISQDNAERIQKIATTHKATPAPELEVYIRKIEDLVANMEKLKQNNPEYFL